MFSFIPIQVDFTQVFYAFNTCFQLVLFVGLVVLTHSLGTRFAKPLSVGT